MNKIDDGFTAISIHGYSTGIPIVDGILIVGGTAYSAVNMFILQNLVNHYIGIYKNKKDHPELIKFITYNWLSEVIKSETVKYF